MMKVFKGIHDAPILIEEDLKRRSASLGLARADGYEFLVVDNTGPLEAALWVLASFRSPLAAVPVNSKLPEEELKRQLACLPKGKWVRSSSLSKLGAHQETVETKGMDSCWAVIFSSGSTGKAKAVAISGAALAHAAFSHKAHLNLKTASWLLQMPIFHIGGLSILSRAHFLGSDLAIPEPPVGLEDFSDWMSSGLIEGASIVPTFLHRLLEARSEYSPQLSCVLVGGAPCPESLLKKALEAGIPVRRTYGMTETSAQVATEISPNEGMRPLPGVSFALGPDGEISVHSPTLALGRYEEGELIPLALDAGAFFTGDIGFISDGVLSLCGRKSELMISGGVNVYPAEIENVFIGDAAINDCAAFSVPDPEWGERILLAVVPASRGTFFPELLQEKLNLSLDRRKHPKQVIVTESIPRTISGKVLRRELASLILGK